MVAVSASFLFLRLLLHADSEEISAEGLQLPCDGVDAWLGDAFGAEEVHGGRDELVFALGIEFWSAPGTLPFGDAALEEIVDGPGKLCRCDLEETAELAGKTDGPGMKFPPGRMWFES